MGETMKCELCGEPMPQGEEMFKFHGYSGPCPAPPLPRKPSEVEQLRAELAAARAEVERLTARLEIDLGGSDKIDELTYALEYVRTEVGQARRTSTYWKDELAAANRECEALSVRASKAEADLAAVRKVEEWEGLRGTRIKWVEAPREPQSEWRAWSWGLRATANPRIVATGDSIIALGRALAAQEGE